MPFTINASTMKLAQTILPTKKGGLIGHALEARKAVMVYAYNIWYRGAVRPYSPTLVERWPMIGKSVERYHDSVTGLWHNERQGAVKNIPIVDRRFKRHHDAEHALPWPLQEHHHDCNPMIRINSYLEHNDRVEQETQGRSTELIDLRPLYANADAFSQASQAGDKLVLQNWDFAESPAVRATSTAILTAPFYAPAFRRKMFIMQYINNAAEHLNWGGHLTGDQYRKHRADHQKFRKEEDDKYDWA